MDPVDRTLRARLGAHASWARTADRASRTAAARAAANARFVTAAQELHPNGSEELIAQVAGHLRKEYFTRLAMAAAAKRRKGARPEAA